MMASTVHITNGDCTTAVLEKSGLDGEILTFRESLVDGPVARWREPAWLDERASHLSAEASEPVETTRKLLERQREEIDRALASPSVVLWFEHDLFCSVNLWYLLAQVPETLATQIELIFPGSFPSRPMFRGLGELNPADFRALFAGRTPMRGEWMSIARRLWEAYAGAEPEELLLVETRDFPFAKEALQLHASRFPSRDEGLGAIELAILRSLEEKPLPFPAIYSAVSTAIGRFGAGDLQISSLIRFLSRNEHPLIAVAEHDGQVAYELTGAAREILDGRQRASRDLYDRRWIGGFELTRETLVFWNRERSVFERT
jgi:hypothetical protein